MSILFPVHRPRVGLSFTEQGLALVELRRGWRKPEIACVAERPLPEKALRPSATDLNILNREIVEQELRVLLQQISDQTVALCLPDQACHLAIFPFETLPPRDRDREPILRWRFQHEEHVALGGDVVMLQRVYPVLRPPQEGQATAKSDGQVTAYVLALAIRRSVLDQYLRICEQVGLLPASISCAALWLFDLYRPTMAQTSELFFVHQAADSMTCFAIRHGLPVFCRSKARRRGLADVSREIQSTVQFYDDLFPHREAASSPIPIYLAGEGPRWTEDLWSLMGQTSWQVQPIYPDWKSVLGLRSAVVQTPEGLCALACAVAR